MPKKIAARRSSKHIKNLGEEIGNSAVRKTVLRTGVVFRLDKTVRPKFHKVMLSKLYEAVNIAKLAAEHSGRSTIQPKDVRLGLKLASIKLLA